MGDVKRYALCRAHLDATMREHPTGYYVEYLDYQSEKARADAAEADARRYRWIRQHCDVIEACDETILGWIFQNNGATKLDDWIDRRAAPLNRPADGGK